jgi:hypothetical protein
VAQQMTLQQIDGSRLVFGQEGCPLLAKAEGQCCPMAALLIAKIQSLNCAPIFLIARCRASRDLAWLGCAWL